MSPVSQRSSPTNHAGGAQDSHHAPDPNAPAVAGSRETSGNDSTSRPMRTLLTVPENASSRARGASSTSVPCTATTARAAHRLPVTLENTKAIVFARAEPVLKAPAIVSAKSGRSATCEAARTRETKISSDASLDAKMVRRDSGSAINTRKSVWSGNRECPTRPTAAATIHIDTAIRNA